MKSVIFALSLILGTSAMAANTSLFKCVVPSDTKAVTVNIDIGDDASADFVTVTLNEKSGASTFFSQNDKGSVNTQIQAGNFNMLALTEKSAQVDGVIQSSGFLALASSNNAFSGFLAANGNIYPLQCTH